MEPKTILITGASSGIGAALALEYANAGVFLAISGRNENRLNQIAKACRLKGAVVIIKIIDVTNKFAMHQWVLELEKNISLDLVIANAGIAGGVNGAGSGGDSIREIFSTNIDGVLNTVVPVLDVMEKRGYGQIAIMSSLASFKGFSGTPSYAATKAAVRIWGEGLRERYSESGLKVSVICPGFVKSRITENNLFPMPFIMSGKKAAKIIRHGLYRNKGRIAFPKIMYFLAWFYGVLPPKLSSFLTPKVPPKE